MKVLAKTSAQVTPMNPKKNSDPVEGSASCRAIYNILLDDIGVIRFVMLKFYRKSRFRIQNDYDCEYCEE